MHALPPITPASAHNTSTCSHATTTAPWIPALPSFSNSESSTATMPASTAPPPPSERLQLPPCQPLPLPPARKPLLRLVSLPEQAQAAPPMLAQPARAVLTSRAPVVSWLSLSPVLLLCCRSCPWTRWRIVHNRLNIFLNSEESVGNVGNRPVFPVIQIVNIEHIFLILIFLLCLAHFLSRFDRRAPELSDGALVVSRFGARFAFLAFPTVDS